MDITSSRAANALVINFHGELDEFGAGKVRGQVDSIIVNNISSDRVIFNLSQLTFMDSTGIGFLLGRYKKLKNFNTPAYIKCNNQAINKLLDLSGLYNIMPKI